MPRPAAETSLNRDSRLTSAAREIRRLTAELADWRASSESATSSRLEFLQNTLEAVHEIDGRAAESISQSNRSELDDYQVALRSAIEEIEALGKILNVERDRLSPRLDAGVREREVRSAYTRTLAKR